MISSRLRAFAPSDTSCPKIEVTQRESCKSPKLSEGPKQDPSPVYTVLNGAKLLVHHVLDLVKRLSLRVIIGVVIVSQVLTRLLDDSNDRESFV